MGTISYPHTGMGIVAGMIFFRGYGYGIELPGGYIPVAIPSPTTPTEGYKQNIMHRINQG